MTEGTLTRRRTFAQVPDALITDKWVTAFAVRLWCRLDRYAGADGNAFPSRERLANDLHVSVATVKRGLVCLVETGWISRKQRTATVWDTVLNDEPVSPDGACRVISDPAAGSPTTHLPGHQRPGEGEPQKETQLKERPWASAPPPPASAPTRTADTSDSKREADRRRFVSLMGVHGHDRETAEDAYAVWRGRGYAWPGAFARHLDDAGQLDGYLGSRGIDGSGEYDDLADFFEVVDDPERFAQWRADTHAAMQAKLARDPGDTFARAFLGQGVLTA